MKHATRNPQPATNGNLLHLALFLIILTFITLHPSPASSQIDTTITPESEAALEEELRWLKAETYVLTASRIPEKIKKTAATIFVITDRQIRQMGARNLLDVLEKMPSTSLFVTNDGGYAPVNRGGFSGVGAAHLLLMVNGHSLNQNYTGGAFSTHDTIIVDNIKRIEFLAGPGSALYGANAFGGVINIITKEADDIDGVNFTTQGGSFDTQQHNLLWGKTINELEAVFNLNYFKTNGFDGHIEEDEQSAFWDPFWGSNASLAPGSTNNDNEKHDTSLTLKYKGFKFDGRYVHRKRDMLVNAPLVTLTNKATETFEDYYLNLSYTGTLWDKLDVYGKVYRNHNHWRRHAQLGPPGGGWLTPIGPVIWSQAGYFVWEIKENRTGIEIQTTYHLSESNTFVLGGSYEEMKQFDHSWRANILETSTRGYYWLLPRLWDLTDIQPQAPSVKRNMKAFFFEDIWDITDAIRLNISGRYDRYSDFGDTFNPRVGLTWEYIKGYDIKLVYGSSFRAPAFAEFYDYGFGNRDLDPEEVDIYQVSLGAEFTSSFSGRLTWVHGKGKDPILLHPINRKYFNGPKIEDHGFEVVFSYNFGRGTYLALNYAYHRPINPDVFLHTPRHIGNIMANIRLSRHLNLYAHCHIEDGFRRDRGLGDTRDDMSGYAIVNTTLIAKKLLEKHEGFEIRGSVYNLFDKDYSSPWLPDQLPHDTPRAGRSFIVELKYKF